MLWCCTHIHAGQHGQHSLSNIATQTKHASVMEHGLGNNVQLTVCGFWK
jgi:hypothetical protein